MDTLKKVVDFDSLLFRGKVPRQRIKQPDQKKGAFKALDENITLVLEVVPGQFATEFARCHRREDRTETVSCEHTSFDMA